MGWTSIPPWGSSDTPNLLHATERSQRAGKLTVDLFNLKNGEKLKKQKNKGEHIRCIMTVKLQNLNSQCNVKELGCYQKHTTSINGLKKPGNFVYIPM